MDYGIEVPSYRRVDSEKEKRKLKFENRNIWNVINYSFWGNVK